MGDQEGKLTAQETENSGVPDLKRVLPPLPEGRPDTYVVLNLLPPERLAWLREQSLRVAEVFTGQLLRPPLPVGEPP
jgi:hypothetical protein